MGAKTIFTERPKLSDNQKRSFLEWFLFDYLKNYPARKPFFFESVLRLWSGTSSELFQKSADEQITDWHQKLINWVSNTQSKNGEGELKVIANSVAKKMRSLAENAKVCLSDAKGITPQSATRAQDYFSSYDAMEDLKWRSLANFYLRVTDYWTKQTKRGWTKYFSRAYWRRYDAMRDLSSVLGFSSEFGINKVPPLHGIRRPDNIDETLKKLVQWEKRTRNNSEGWFRRKDQRGKFFRIIDDLKTNVSCAFVRGENPQYLKKREELVGKHNNQIGKMLRDHNQDLEKVFKQQKQEISAESSKKSPSFFQHHNPKEEFNHEVEQRAITTMDLPPPQDVVGRIGFSFY